MICSKWPWKTAEGLDLSFVGDKFIAQGGFMEQRQMKRGFQHCPVCKVKIYLNNKLYYSCPNHGQYRLDYQTGKMELVNKGN